MGTTTIKAITRNNLKPNGSYGVIITHITYDDFNNPVRIQFDNGNVTKYVYSATGQKLRTIHYTAVENTHVSMGCDLEDIEDIYLAVDSTDYLLGGSVIYVNERLSKILFDGGYVDASYAGGPHLSYKYYNRDHLGNNREVVDESGAVLQRTDYYPFGTPFSSPSSTINAGLQPFKYNNKELDMMHGLNTYDYGARQYYPLLPMWDRVDPLAEKYYPFTPYSYCAGNPIRYIDPTGMDYWSTSDPDEINAFLKTLQTTGSADSNMEKWNHTKDADFLANLTYNDKTDKYWYSYCTEEDGEVVCNGVSFDGSYQKSFSDSFLAWFEDANTVSDCSGKSLKNYAGNSTVGSNGKFYWHAAGERGFYGNQYVSTTNLAKVGRTITKITGPVGMTLGGVDAYVGYLKDGGKIGYHTARATANYAGGLAGAAVGLKYGAMLGTSLGGVPGTVIGGAVGGISGSFGGNWFGTSCIDYLYGQ